MVELSLPFSFPKMANHRFCHKAALFVSQLANGNVGHKPGTEFQGVFVNIERRGME